MKKILVTLLVISLALTSVFAQGGAEQKAAKGEEKMSLMLYTSLKESLIGGVRDAFKAKYPNIEFDYYSAGAGKLMAKIATERQAGNIACDVIWTSEIPDFINMKREGILMPYLSPEKGKVVSTIDDPEGFFTAARLGTLGIAYNTTMIKDPPKTWEDLLKPEFKDNFSIANPALSGTSFVSVSMMVENLGWDYIQKLADNGTRMGQGSGQVVDDTAAGDVAACIGVDYITIDKIVKGANLGFSYLDSMFVVPSPIAIMANTKNDKAAKLFVDFVLSSEGQELIAKTYTLPVRNDVPIREDLGLVTPEVAKSKAMALDYEKLSSHKEAYIEKFTKIIQHK